METDSRLEIGRIVRPHGLSGELVVDLVSNRAERTVAGSRFECGGRQLRTVRARRARDRWLFSFEGVETLEQAEALRGEVLYAEPLTDETALWIHDLVGSEVFDNSQKRLGTVRSVVANPASDLIELEDGQLIPVRFVVSSRDKKVRVDIPEGLLE